MPETTEFPRTDGRTRRALLFSAAFIGLVVTVANHKVRIAHPETATGLAATDSVGLKTHSRKQSLGYDDNSSPADKIKVRLYTETNCPACKKFIAHYVNKVIAADGMSNIVDFKFVPWGNGRVTKDGVDQDSTAALSALLSQSKTSDGGAQEVPGVKFECQHGGPECTANAYASCVQHLYPDTSQFFPVIDCMNSRACDPGVEPSSSGCRGAPDAVGPMCVADSGHGMDADKISQCATGPLGAQLLLTNALETAELQPAKTWVPWVTVNNKHLGSKGPSEVFLLGHAICDAWAATGGRKPKPCYTFPHNVPSNVLAHPPLGLTGESDAN